MQKAQPSKSVIDKAVVEALGEDYTREKPRRQKTAAQLEKIERDKARNTIRVDLPERLILSLKNLANNHATSVSQIVCLLLVIGLRAVVEGKIDIRQYKTFSRSPRYDWKIRIPAVPKIELENRGVEASVDTEE